MVDCVPYEIVTYVSNSDNDPFKYLDLYYRDTVFGYQIVDSFNISNFLSSNYLWVVRDISELPSEPLDGIVGLPMTLTDWIHSYLPLFSIYGDTTKFGSEWLMHDKQFPNDLTYCVVQSYYFKNDGTDDDLRFMVYVKDTTLGNSWYRIDYYFDNIYLNPSSDYHDTTDIYLLYDFGKGLIDNNPVLKLLNTDLGGTTLSAVLFGGGFVLYVAWVIVKWAIPL